MANRVAASRGRGSAGAESRELRSRRVGRAFQPDPIGSDRTRRSQAGKPDLRFRPAHARGVQSGHRNRVGDADSENESSAGRADGRIVGLRPGDCRHHADSTRDCAADQCRRGRASRRQPNPLRRRRGPGRDLVPIRDRLARQARPPRGHGRRRRDPRRRRRWSAGSLSSATAARSCAEAGQPDPPCRLYRNRGDWRFEDITGRAGAPGPSYAMGAAVGDYDGDGRDDLFVTGWRDQRLYRNLGGGRFEDVTRRAGLASNSWSTSAAFADLDGDGDLDLYVATYLVYDPESAPFCAAPDGRARLLRPRGLPGPARSPVSQQRRRDVHRCDSGQPGSTCRKGAASACWSPS